MIIATWNVNSILARLPNVIRWIDNVNPDVVCMQETKCSDDKFPLEPFEQRGYRCQLFGQQTYNGVAIVTRDGCDAHHRGYPGDDETTQSRLIATEVRDIQLITVYIPNGQAVGSDKYEFKLDWMSRLRGFLDSHYAREKAVLLCGDFNVAPEERDVHDPRLWNGRIMCSERERASLENIKAWGFTDAFRQHTDSGGHFTWWDYRAGAFRRNLGLRIDHIWISASLVSRNVKTWIDIEPRKWEKPSDHAPVVTELAD